MKVGLGEEIHWIGFIVISHGVGVDFLVSE
jgi:hypothetical protein